MQHWEGTSEESFSCNELVLKNWLSLGMLITCEEKRVDSGYQNKGSGQERRWRADGLDVSVRCRMVLFSSYTPVTRINKLRWKNHQIMFKKQNRGIREYSHTDLIKKPYGSLLRHAANWSKEEPTGMGVRKRPRSDVGSRKDQLVHSLSHHTCFTELPNLNEKK